MDPFGPHNFLANAKGVIHVGANQGEERTLYNNYQQHVVWVEAAQEAFYRLRANIEGYPLQRAYHALITDRTRVDTDFNISNNDCASSSIFELDQHKDIWPTVNFKEKVIFKSISLVDFLNRERINYLDYQILVMDVQGAEILVLKGARDFLPSFHYIKAEAADFESYKGGARLSDLGSFLDEFGFVEVKREPFAMREQGGTYYDVVWRKRSL